MLRKILMPWLAGLIVLCGGFPAATRAADTPNIIFALFDDLGYGQPDCFRADSEFKTPALDRLAREGLRFTDAHSAASVCTPTRYGVLTGRYPARLGQYGVLTTYSPPIIPKSRLTVPRLLQQHGYHTACIGKWHLGVTWDGKPGSESEVPVDTPFGDGPTTLGFDHFTGFTHARNIGTLLAQDRVAAHLTAVEVQPHLAQAAVQYVTERAAAGQPFFLYLPLCPPHTPIVPAPEFAGQGGVEGDRGEVAYADWLYQGDWVLGQVLAALDQHQLTERTLIIASSDNGAAGRAYAPLRGSKSSIYEGGHRVPFVARWPGRVAAGTTCQATVCLNDLLATCADIVDAKLPPDAGEDSVSLLPLLQGSSEPVRESVLHQSPGKDLALRQGEWKLILHADGKQELFQLADDLSEQHDVAAANPDVTNRMRNRLQEIIANGRTTAGLPQPNDIQWTLDAKPSSATPRRRKKAAD